MQYASFFCPSKHVFYWEISQVSQSDVLCAKCQTHFSLLMGLKLARVKGNVTIGSNVCFMCLKKYSEQLGILVLVNHIQFCIKVIIFGYCQAALNCSHTWITG
jgi:hypothetical protein